MNSWTPLKESSSHSVNLLPSMAIKTASTTEKLEELEEDNARILANENAAPTGNVRRDGALH